jgi:hemerythrin-like metal-binding protein
MEIKKIIDFILIVAKIHFLTEEYLMKSMKYLQLEEHQKEHHSFLITLEYFKEQLNQKDWQQIQNTIEKLSNYLSKWLVEHISYADLNGYGRFLQEKDKKLFSNWLDL